MVTQSECYRGHHKIKGTGGWIKCLGLMLLGLLLLNPAPGWAKANKFSNDLDLGHKGSTMVDEIPD